MTTPPTQGSPPAPPKRAPRYGDYQPRLFWFLKPDAPVLTDDPMTIGHVLVEGSLKEIFELVSLDVLERELPNLGIPDYTRRFWSRVLEIRRSAASERPPVLSPNPNVLSQLHRSVLRAAARANASEGVPDLRMEGDTALAAFYLGHRRSEGLDFTGGQRLDARRFVGRIGEELRRDGLAFEISGTPNTKLARFVAREPDSGEAVPVRLATASFSTVLLEPLRRTTEGILVASFQDLCARTLHALAANPAAIVRTRLPIEPRDYIDVHAILHRPADEGAADENLVLTRFRSLLDDVAKIDPGLDARYIGQGFARGIGQPLISLFPLRLLEPLTDDELQATLRLCFDECAQIVNELSQGS